MSAMTHARQPWVPSDEDPVSLTGFLAEPERHGHTLLIVRGGAGSGRTVLLRDIARSWEGTALISRCRPGDGELDALRRALPPDPGTADSLPALAAQLHRLGSDQPVLLVLDDLHHAHEATVGALGSLMRAPGSARLALAVALDPDAVSVPLLRLLWSWAARLDVREIRLGSDGPHKLEAYDDAEPTTDHISTAPGLDALSEETGQMLSFAAMLGATFSIRSLCVATGRPMTDLLPGVLEAVRSGLVIDAGERELAFARSSIRDAILQRLPRAVRGELHRDIALRLEAGGAPVATVAQHMLAMDVVPEDLEWVGGVATKVVPSSARTAVQLWQHLRSVVDESDPRSSDIDGDLAAAELVSGRLRSAELTARSALLRFGPDRRAGALHLALSTALLRQRRWADARLAAEDAASSASLLPEERADQLALAGMAAMLEGDFDASMSYLARAERASGAVAADLASVRTLMLRGHVSHLRGDLASAERALGDSSRLAERLDSRAGYDSGAHARHALVLADLDRFEEATTLVEVALAATRREGATAGRQSALLAAGCLRLDLGDLSGAADVIDSGVGLLEAGAGLLHPLGVARRTLVALHVHGAEGAARWAGRLPTDLQEAVFLCGFGWLIRARAALLAAEGDAAGAHRELEDGWQLCLTHGVQSELPVLGVELAASASERADADRARSVAEVLEGIAARNPVAARIQDIALTARALVEPDGLALGDAWQQWVASPRLLEAARVAELIARRLAALGAPGARSLAEEAAQRYSRAGATGDAQRVRAWTKEHYVGHAGPELNRPKEWDALTRTERVIAEYVERGHSNSEIARRLVVSRRTVETHVSHILAKLDLRSRADLVLAAAQRARIVPQAGAQHRPGSGTEESPEPGAEKRRSARKGPA